MRVLSILVFLMFVSIPVFAQDHAKAVREAHGDWTEIKRIQFTWTVVPRNVSRTYDWDRKSKTVRVTIGGKTVTISESGVGLKTGEEAEAHKAFINDSYWLLFEQFMFRDQVILTEDSGKGPNITGPNITKKGASEVQRRIRVQYKGGGYTPGDAYMLYLAADGRVKAWEYFPGGAAEPRFYITREGYVSQAGIVVPTRFMQGEAEFIRIDDLKME